MIRTVLGIVLGYVTMLVIVFITLTGSYLALGMGRTFQPNSYQVTPLWMFVMMAFSFVAAIIAGKVCRIVSGGRLALIPLTALVLVLGLTSAVAAILGADSSIVRSGDVSNWQAMMNAQQPAWAALLLPALCAVGVVIGGRDKKKEPSS